jgi:hypothetical protein
MKKTLFFCCIAITFGLFTTCEKNNEKSTVDFSCSVNALKSALAGKCVSDSTDIYSVLASIQTSTGENVQEKTEIILYQFNGQYISKPLSLKTGKYKLTEFLVVNSKHTILYASPKAGSAEANLVQRPLSIAFEVCLNNVTHVIPEVLAIENKKPEDFGYVVFGFEIVNGKKIILQPDSTTGKDAVIGLIIPNENRGKSTHSSPYAWTQEGILNVTRPLLEFDLSAVPAGQKITKATLFLYMAPYANLTQHSGDNGFIIQRIIEKWDENIVTWNNQPATTTENQITVAASQSSTQNYVIDVTSLIQDNINNPETGHGLMLKLITEQAYRVALLASSDNADATKRPKLVIEY